MIEAQPLVSVIIPCYNHGRFLAEAIQSVKSQTHSNVEIIVVDDGSSDNTETVAKSHGGVTYIYQANQGLSAARNTGIRNSKGEFLIFLDADDWLYDGAIAYNLQQLLENREAAFVSGAYDVVSHDKKKIGEKGVAVNTGHYVELLKSNYIGMHATVMYRRWIFDKVLYDTTLRTCEDYDLYLKIARDHPVIHHTRKMAAYRMHGSNMSDNSTVMLDQVLLVLKRQKPFFRSDEERKAYRLGVRHYKFYYSYQFYNFIIAKGDASKENIALLRKQNWFLYMRYLIKKLTPDFGLQWLNRVGLYDHYRPKPGKVRLGSMRSLLPFSDVFGFDRGTPIDRYYIENFLQAEAGQIKGRVLEIGDNEYTMRYGKERVQQSDILYIDDSNTKATIIGDLCNAPHIEDNSFDAIVLTQTLHVIYDYKSALKTCYRILKPGGTLLLTSPGITPVDVDEWSFYYSFTEKSLKKILAESFPANQVETECYGNVMVATAFLYGMSCAEVKKKQLDHRDPRFQVIITAKAVKPA